MSRSGIQLAYPFEEKRLAKWQPPYIVQPKYDGERCRAVPIGEGKYMLLSSEENPFFSVPHIIEDLSKLGIDEELDGELYCHGMNFEQIHSIVSRTVNLHPNHMEIKYHVFDYVSEEPQMVRMASLTKLISAKWNKSIIRSSFFVCQDLEEIMKTYVRFLNEGYEGMIVRHIHAPYVRKRSIYMMKWKPKREDIYEILGWKEEFSISNVPKGRMGALVCSSQEGESFSVGSGLSDEVRETLWTTRESLKGKRVRVQYQHLTSGKKVPRFPVFVEVIE